MLAIALWLLASSVIPRVDDPWPESIGIGFPFTLAGAGSVLAGILASETSQAQRDRATSRWATWGFRFGAAVYVLALLNQVASGA